MVPLPCSPSRRRAPSTTSRTSFTPAVTADRGTKCLDGGAWPPRWPAWSCRCPGGPHRMAEVSRSDSMSARSGAPGPTRWRWPTMSSSVRGRSRAASGRPRRQAVGGGAGEEVLAGHRRLSPASGSAGARGPRSAPAASGFGASVIGSQPDWVFGKAITSRMLSSPAKMATRRSSPTANPAWGGAPKRNAPSRNPKRDAASSSLIPSAAKIRLWMSARCTRTLPEPSSQPLSTRS